jgi:hypothetical protein
VPLAPERRVARATSAGAQIPEGFAETARDASTAAAALRYPARARRGQAAAEKGEKNDMSAAATAPASAVVFLFVLSFICFMSGAALRRWPDEIQAYFERVDGSLWFVSPGTHRALVQATGIALTSLSLLAVIGARLIS